LSGAKSQHRRKYQPIVAEVQMEKQLPIFRILGGIFLAATLAAFPGIAAAQNASKPFVSRDASIDGAKIHYTTGGSGPAVILLHGFAETSRMWNPILPALGQKFTVIAPDLPGIGDSSIPSGTMDMKSAAIQIHDLARSLGVKKARVVGHDIGLMLAYAYAAQFPSEVEKLVVMDAFLPGVQGWEPIYDSPDYWHFRFNGPTPEALVKGRETIYFAYFWNDLAADKNHSIPEADRKAYLAAYSRPGRMHASWEYFVSWPQTAKDFAQMARTKLTMPVLSIGGDKSLGEALAAQMRLVASNVTVVIVKNSGHWILEEQPKQTINALVNFL
jgi:pimeloyl-ACP methyl ester carboxylesterase